MSAQETGFIGRFVGGMIRRSIRSKLRNLWWSPPKDTFKAPAIVYANHHGWLDGYVMFHAMAKLSLPSLAWVEEYDAFPLFRFVGALRYAKGDLEGRVKTIRQTMRKLSSEGKSLVLFPEGILHRPPTVLPFQKALHGIATKVPEAALVPVAIVYEQSIHERPEAWIEFGEPHAFVSLADCRERLEALLGTLRTKIQNGDEFQLLAAGTASVNERWDMRRIPKK